MATEREQLYCAVCEEPLAKYAIDRSHGDYCGPFCAGRAAGRRDATTKQLDEIAREAGATSVQVDFGDEAFITFDFRDDRLGGDEGWHVIDNRRRYPSQIAAHLKFEDAARHAKSLRTNAARSRP